MFKDKKNLQYLWLFLILVLVLFFRLKGLAIRDIWYDEALDVIQSEKSLLQITHDVPTPIHYYFVHFFLWFGRSTFILGLPSVLFGLGSVYLLFLIGKKILDKNLGLIAAFLMAISPMHIEFSQQILHYSYFAFFTLLALLFYLDFILAISQKKIKWKSLGLFILFSLLNFLTHVPALLVFLIEFVFLFYFLIANYQVFKKYKKYMLFLVPILIFIIYSVFFFNNGYYWYSVIADNLKFNVTTPIQLGFSLSKQLETASLSFNLPFFVAMFSWFGLGAGFRLLVYFLLFLVGLWVFVKNRKYNLLSFFLIWIILPFVYLYFVRLEHWFEEKYFIFIIPVYLLIIAEGIIYISSYLKQNFLKYLLLFFIFCLALNPIKIRTTYGFPVKEDSHYSWRAVYNYLQQNMKTGDRVFVRRGEGVMPQFYFGTDFKNKVWFEEDYVLSLSADGYQNLVQDTRKNYFVSIPDFQDTFLSPVTSVQYLAKVGEHNLYQINFLKRNNLQIVANKEGDWGYYEDFSTAKYLTDAESWENVMSTYAGNYNLPMTYGFYNLSPQDFKDTYITYRLSLPANEGFFIKPFFFLDKGVTFKVSLGNSQQEMKEVYQKESSNFTYFNPLIKVEDKNLNPQDLFLRIDFKIDKNQTEKLKNIGLKSIWIFNQFDSQKKDYQTVVQDKTINYFYQVGLETIKSRKWLRQTVTNEGWIQSIDGILFRLYGQPEENPLVFQFVFPQKTFELNLDFKTYVFDNEMDVYTKIDDEDWRLWPIKNDNETKSHNSLMIGGEKLEIKFICQKEGSTCQLRELKLNAKANQ